MKIIFFLFLGTITTFGQSSLDSLRNIYNTQTVYLTEQPSLLQPTSRYHRNGNTQPIWIGNRSLRKAIEENGSLETKAVFEKARRSRNTGNIMGVIGTVSLVAGIFSVQEGRIRDFLPFWMVGLGLTAGSSFVLLKSRNLTNQATWLHNRDILFPSKDPNTHYVPR